MASAAARCGNPMITVRLPAILRRSGVPDEVVIDEPVGTVADLVLALDRRHPGLAAAIDDALYNFAVNDAIVLHKAQETPLRDGDVVEIVPTIAGG